MLSIERFPRFEKIRLPRESILSTSPTTRLLGVLFLFLLPMHNIIAWDESGRALSPERWGWGAGHSLPERGLEGGGLKGPLNGSRDSGWISTK